MKVVKSCGETEVRVCEDKISELPDDLILHILWYVPTKDAILTMFLSKRWKSVWKMMAKLEYKDSHKDDDVSDEDVIKSEKSVWWFLDKSMKLHKAPVIVNLSMELGTCCHINADVGKWVAKAVSSFVRVLTFELRWYKYPTNLPKSIYTCKSLVYLHLSHKILVDAPSSSSCLPSLSCLKLDYVVYKDDDSLVNLLSGCPVLKMLTLKRIKDDNLNKITVEVPSLWSFYYERRDVGGTSQSCVIDTPALELFKFIDTSGDHLSIISMPCLNKADVGVLPFPGDRFLRSLSSVLSLVFHIVDEVLVCCNTTKFSRLKNLQIFPYVSDWFKPLMVLLGNSPNLKNLVVDCVHISEDVPVSWNQPSSVPRCISSELEIFEWQDYGGREEEEQFLTYILTNSESLKTTTIFLSPTLDPEKQDLIIKKLKDIPRVSPTSQLLFE